MLVQEGAKQVSKTAGQPRINNEAPANLTNEQYFSSYVITDYLNKCEAKQIKTHSASTTFLF